LHAEPASDDFLKMQLIPPIGPDMDKSIIHDNLLGRFKMKTRYLLHALFLFCVIGVLLNASPAFSEDKIERSCKAYYAVRVFYREKVADHWVEKNVTLAMKDYEFSARRGCGRTVPDRCRKRALEAIEQCMVAHAKNPATTPAACTSNGVVNYRITNLEKAVQETVCKYANVPNHRLNLPNIYQITLTNFPSGEECYTESMQGDLGSFKVTSCPAR
jgi:hypothetical protein